METAAPAPSFVAPVTPDTARENRLNQRFSREAPRWKVQSLIAITKVIADLDGCRLLCATQLRMSSLHCIHCKRPLFGVEREVLSCQFWCADVLVDQATTCHL